ncbi:transmembrane protease serine 9 isoform X1 [Panthera pardus]|uniref:Transmembrane protease serine 9 isoform X1 n=1 Tax=Panthera pardus TaxID=9691 RepID=A0A9W2V2Y5_PANPR|nr:transmembrane protease serine 9 isoform X1 [Panthera pardus]
MEPTAGDLQLVPGTAKEVPAPYTSCCRMALCVVVATSIIMVTLGVLMASLSTQGVNVEHTAELQGVRYAHSLQHEASDYYRTLTPVLEWLFVSSFRETELEASCVGCTVLSYRDGNSSVFVHFRLHFLLQASQSLSLGLEEELLRQGLRARLQGHGIPLAAHGTIVSAQLTGNQKAPWTERDLKSGHCPGNTFSCRNGQCVTKVNPECDDRVDCSDGSDEAHCDCGLQPGWKTAGRIVGGVEASPGEFPWQVSLRENKEHFCGAAVVGARWLVSAAHCFSGFQDPAEWVAYAGTTHLSGAEASTVRVRVARITPHPLYNPDTADFDVAVLELDGPLAFGRHVQPVCLPAATHVFPPRRKCLISGWGYLKEDFLVKPETLQKATVELLDQGLCASLYGHSLTDRMLCAGYLDGKVDSCQGDSGGPLVCEEPSGRFFLAGIVSWGIGCAEAGRPGVYARVTRLRDWILEAITTAGRPLAPTAAPASTTASTARPTSPESPARPTLGLSAAPPDSVTASKPQECGARPAMEKPTRIVGGLGAVSGEVPWQVSLKEGSRHFCGATVVGDRWLLSAAHCFNHTKVELVRAHLGTASLTGVGGNPVKMGLKRAVLHPQYNPGILDFDVAVLELAGPLGFNKYIQPVCLPLAIQKFPVGRKCMISGWGNTQEGNATKPDILQRASVGIIDQKACSALYNSSLTDRMLCAGFLEGKVDSCQGDSGGPLACEEAPGVFYLAGIVSWGVGCAQARRPGVYTRITRLKGWILDTMSSGLLPTARTPATRQSSGTAAAFTVPGVPASTATPSATSRATSQPANMTAATVTATAGGQTPLPDPPRTTVGFQPPDCGLAPAAAMTRIVGGSAAARGEWPWQVSLWLRRREHRCGAVLVAERWLLSAAHCFDVYGDPKQWAAFLGTPFLSGAEGQLERVARIYKHPFYNLYTLDYDVALLELAGPVRRGRLVRPICLPEPTPRPPDGARCVITGWGSVREGGSMARQLQKAAVRLLSEQTCRRFYPVQISSRMLCAGFPQGGVDSCSVSALCSGSGRFSGPRSHTQRARGAWRGEVVTAARPSGAALSSPPSRAPFLTLEELSLDHRLLGIHYEPVSAPRHAPPPSPRRHRRDGDVGWAVTAA